MANKLNLLHFVLHRGTVPTQIKNFDLIKYIHMFILS